MTMWSRLTVVPLALFWLLMMTLLWRSEFGRKPVGASVPVNKVFDRILSAPDMSTLDIRHGTNHIGYCRVRADIGQEFATGARLDESDELEGMVEHLSYYRLDVDGNVAIPDLPHRARFDLTMKLSTNRVWQEFALTLNLRPDVYKITANATSQIVVLSVDAGAEKFERQFTFADLQNPQKLLLQLGGPALPLMLGVVGTKAASTNMADSLGLRWSAHSDGLLLGRNSVRAYRLTATLLDRYKGTFYVSPVGEILRVELPDNIYLVNQAVSPLQAKQ